MTTESGPNIITNGLIFSIDGLNLKSYSGTGSVVNDLSTSLINGNLINSASVDASGIFSLNYLNSQYLDFPNNNTNIQFLNNSPYTLEAWVYPTIDPGTNNYTGIFNRESVFNGVRDGWNLWYVGLSASTSLFSSERFKSASVNSLDSVSETVSTSAVLNQWQHLVVTYNGISTMLLYRNTIQTGGNAAVSGSITNTVKTLTIGVRNTQYWRGNLGPCRIYNRALSQTEIKQNYNASRSRFGV